MNTSAGSSKNIPTSGTANASIFHDYKVPSSEFRGRISQDEQSVVSNVEYKHLWLRDRHTVPYDFQWHMTYLATGSFFFGSIATIMTSRVRNNNIAKFANMYRIGSLVFGLGVGQVLHDDWQRTRWYYDDDDDI